MYEYCQETDNHKNIHQEKSKFKWLRCFASTAWYEHSTLAYESWTNEHLGKYIHSILKDIVIWLELVEQWPFLLNDSRIYLHFYSPIMAFKNESEVHTISEAVKAPEIIHKTQQST